MVMTLCFLHSAIVQTGLVRLVTDELSVALNTHAEIGRIHYQWPAKLQIDDIYLEDQQGDTLAAIGHLYAHFSPRALLDSNVLFHKVEIEGVRAYAHQDPWGEMNYQFLIDAFSGPQHQKDSTESKTPLAVRYRMPRIRISDIRGHYMDHAFDVGEIQIHIPLLDGRLDSIAGEVAIRQAHYRDAQLERLYINGIYNDTTLTGTVRLSGKWKDDVIELTGDVDGKLDSISAQSLQLKINHKNVLDGNILAIGLPEIDSLYVHAECRDLCLRSYVVQDIISNIQGRPFRFAEPVHRLGEVHYRGILDGRLDGAKLKGAFTTAQGTITTDAWVKTDRYFSHADFRGRVSTPRFKLGRMLNREDIGSITAAVESQVHFEIGHQPIGDITGKVKSAQLRGHTYRNLTLNADYWEEEVAQLDIAIDDENIDLHLNGRCDWSDESPQTNISVALHHFRPGEMGLSETYADMTADMDLSVDIYGKHLDDMTGYIVADSLRICRSELGDTLTMGQLKIELESDGRYHRWLLTSDVATGRLEGIFDYQTLSYTLAKIGAQYVPSLFRGEKQQQMLQHASNNQVDAYLYGHELQHLQYILSAPLRVGDYPVLKLYIDESQNKWGVQGYVSELNTRSSEMRNITLAADNQRGAARLEMAADMGKHHMALYTRAECDSITTRIVSTGDSAIVRGEAAVTAHITTYKRKPLYTVEVDNSVLVYNDSVYRIQPSTITYNTADTTITVDHFRGGTERQWIDVDGIASTHIDDVLKVKLSNIDAHYLVSKVLPEKTLTAEGSLSGEATLYGIMRKPTFEANLQLKDGGINSTRFADATVAVKINEERDKILITGDFPEVCAVDGEVNLTEHSFGLDIRVDSVPMGFVEHWTSNFLVDYGGYATGHVHVSDDGKHHTYVTAEVLPHDVHVTVPFTGCTYFIHDSCFMDSLAIRFPKMIANDREGNPLELEGILRHQNFANFDIDLHIHSKKALAIDIPSQTPGLIHGKIYFNGDVQLKGPDNMLQLSANAKTAGHSEMELALGGANNAGSTSFITFIDHNHIEVINTKPDYSLPKVEKRKRKQQADNLLPSNFLMGLNLEATPNLTVKLVTNQKTGDCIEAKGNGALRLTYNDKQNNFGLTGTYTIDQGKMGFTLANTFHRNFEILDGSTIIFSGNAETPELDVRASYRVTASIRDLFGTDAHAVTKSRTSVPVDVIVRVNGTLSDPTIRFSLNLPSADDAVRAQVSAVVNTEEMLMRQVVYLVAFGRFYTPDGIKTNTATGVNESFSLLSSTITGQINSWLGKLTDRVQMGVNVRNENGFGSDSEQEYEAQFQIQPHDRLLINGNFGYRYSQVSNQPFFGDLDVEVLITDDGKVRLKAFTHMVDKYSMKQNNASTVQGLGVVFKHDF